MDFAKYINDDSLVQGVIDMLEDYHLSIGVNHIHRDKTGHFDNVTQQYFPDNVLLPEPYMDQIDTWRAIPALSGLLLVHPETVPIATKTAIFDYWWNNYAGGHSSLYGATQEKPIEIYSDLTYTPVLTVDSGYKTMGMWMPLGAAYDADYTTDAVNWLVNNKYSANDEYFYGANYFGGYFSQFAQRAIGAATGMISPEVWHSEFGLNQVQAKGVDIGKPIVRHGDQSLELRSKMKMFLVMTGVQVFGIWYSTAPTLA